MNKTLSWIRKASADIEALLYATVDRLRMKYDHVEIRPLDDGGYAVFVAND